VTGAAGMLGQAVCARAPAWASVAPLRRDDGDLSVRDDARRALAKVAPAIIIHCAAYTDVDGCTRDPARAWANNAVATEKVAQMAGVLNARLLYVSTAFVFDGTKVGPYAEDDEPAPLNVYGESKLVGERSVSAAGSDHLIVRPHWLFGPGGKNFVASILNIARARKHLRVVEDERGCPTYTPDLAEAIWRLLETEVTGIVHVTNQGACSRLELTVAALEEAGLADVKVEGIASAAWDSPTTRPLNAVLGSERLNCLGVPPLRPWREALREYVRELIEALSRTRRAAEGGRRLNKPQTTRARAPVRIDFAGGWTDVPPFSTDKGGYVVNAAISRHSYATLIPNDTGEFLLESADYDEYVHAKDIRQLEYNGTLDLLKAAVVHKDLDFGGHLLTRSEAPPGSGTGSSASMGVALIGLLDAIQGGALTRHEIAAMANELEVDELDIQGGKQDQYVAACGGLCFMTFHDSVVEVERLDPSTDFLLELEKLLLLVYTGKSRLSGDIISRVMGAYRRGEPGITEALINLRDAALQMRDAFVSEDLRLIGEVLDFNWENQKRLYDEMTTPKIEALFQVARSAGLLGGKACGAGGGGCIALLCEPDREHLVRRAVEDLGGQCIEFNFDHEGLRGWRPGYLIEQG